MKRGDDGNRAAFASEDRRLAETLFNRSAGGGCVEKTSVFLSAAARARLQKQMRDLATAPSLASSLLPRGGWPQSAQAAGLVLLIAAAALLFTRNAPIRRDGPGEAAQVYLLPMSALTPGGPRIADSTNPTAAPASAVPPRPMTEEERKAWEREQKRAEEQARLEAQAYARAQAVEGRRIAEERARAEKAAKEQAKRDAEAAKKAQEAARKQAEREREQQKAVAEAAARLKAAEAAYNAEVAKKNNNP